MARSDRRGYGESRSPEVSSKAYRTPLIRCALTLVIMFFAVLYARAQDENVHIEPKPPAPPKTVESNEVAGNPDAQKNHGKPAVSVDVNLVLVNVTVTDDWNRIV